MNREAGMSLNSPLAVFFRLTEIQKKALTRVKLITVLDLLFYFPNRYSDISELRLIKEIEPGETVTIYGKVVDTKVRKAFRSKMPMGEATVEDSSGKIKVVWFNQPYLAKMIKVGQIIKMTGKVTPSSSGIYIANPEFEKTPDMPIDIHDSLFQKEDRRAAGWSYPIYPETSGLSSKWIYHAVQKIIKEGALDEIVDYIPEDILKKYHLPTLKTALIWIHMPQKENDATVARKRFAFEEVFFIQLERQHDRMEYQKKNSFRIKSDPAEIKNFIDRFPFKPTPGQEKAIDQILKDFDRPAPMSRLLEGDVGSGKTFVAAAASYVTTKTRPFDFAQGKPQDFGNLQVAYMAPTEILANQHFESFIKNFKHLPINIALITGSGCKKFPSKTYSPANGGVNWTDISRTQLLKWVANGEIPILLGTHALIQKSVTFKNLALVIVDEQHRFGTNQRMKLAKKSSASWRMAPHFLSMTATPIPRTLALTIYGDLDLTLLDDMPAGRKQVVTEIITPTKRDETYEKIKKELEAGRQLYVICPRIFEPDPEKEMALNVKSIIAEAKRLEKEVFPEYSIGVLHSKMTKQKKEEVMQDFTDGKITILCATSVVEVGVNVPNATVIIIEGAERFGLAQLHQLRGRVIRSNHQAYCYIFTSDNNKTPRDKNGKSKTLDRLNALKTAKNGFELAELDLALRGAGELGGGKQWGITDIGMEAIKNIKMVEAARTEAQALIKVDPELEGYPLLKQKVKLKTDEFHFE